MIGLQDSEVQVLHSADGKIKDRDLNAFNVVISYKNLSTLNLEISMFKQKNHWKIYPHEILEFPMWNQKIIFYVYSELCV